MIKALICGAGGKMGKELISLMEKSEDIMYVCGVDIKNSAQNPPIYSSFNDVTECVDVIIDFSSPKSLDGIISFAKDHKTPVVIATTGYTDEQRAKICQLSEDVPVFMSANFSLGINLLSKLIKTSCKILGDEYDIEIVETHHRQKKDSPSGTALMLKSSIEEVKGKQDIVFGREGRADKRGSEIGIHSLRGGTVCGEHEVLFLGNDETISLKHSAQSRSVFAQGAIKAAIYLCGKTPGPGLYNMDNLLCDFDE